MRSLWVRLGLVLALLTTWYGFVGFSWHSSIAQPPIPHCFYGTVEIDGEPAPVGTVVEGRGEGVRTDREGNPIITTEVGKYGKASSSDPSAPMYVQGDLADGDPIEFYVNDVRAECYVDGEWVDTYPFEQGAVTELDLRAERAPFTRAYLPLVMRYYQSFAQVSPSVGVRLNGGTILRGGLR